MAFYERLYGNLPVLAQHLACSAYGWRERRARGGVRFNQKYKWLRLTDHAKSEEISAHQDAAVRDVVRLAYDSVPYYRRVWQAAGIDPRDIKGRSDLCELPIVTKHDVADNPTEFLSSTYRGQLRYGATSGTTGTALSVPLSLDAVAFQWAVWWRHRWRFGVAPGQWHVNFTGRPVVPRGQADGPMWRWNLPMRQVLLPMQSIRRETIAKIVQFLNARNFEFYSGYPSFIHTFCEMVRDEGLTLEKPPRVIFFGAEKLHDFQRRAIEQVTGALLTDQYGFTEACGNASRCEAGVYHEDWEFGVLECGSAGGSGGLQGKIIATGFANAAFPLVRYEVGDVAEWMPQEWRCACGRESLAIREIDGRNEDYVITPEGNRIMRFGYLFKRTPSIREAQVVQTCINSITLKIVPRQEFCDSDRRQIEADFAEYISPSMKLQFEICSAIPRSRSGKFRAVVSELGSPKVQSV